MAWGETCMREHNTDRANPMKPQPMKSTNGWSWCLWNKIWMCTPHERSVRTHTWYLVPCQNFTWCCNVAIWHVPNQARKTYTWHQWSINVCRFSFPNLWCSYVYVIPLLCLTRCVLLKWPTSWSAKFWIFSSPWSHLRERWVPKKFAWKCFGHLAVLGHLVGPGLQFRLWKKIPVANSTWHVLGTNNNQ